MLAQWPEVDPIFLPSEPSSQLMTAQKHSDKILSDADLAEIDAEQFHSHCGNFCGGCMGSLGYGKDDKAALDGNCQPDMKCKDKDDKSAEKDTAGKSTEGKKDAKIAFKSGLEEHVEEVSEYLKK